MPYDENSFLQGVAVGRSLKGVSVISGGGGGGGGFEYETGTFSPEADISRPLITFRNVHTEAPVLIAMSDITDAAAPTYTNLVFQYFDPYKLFGAGFRESTNQIKYGTETSYHKNSTSLGGASTETFQYPSDNAGDSSVVYPRYWATETGFVPGASASRYWRSGRTYKWIAIWKPAE